MPASPVKKTARAPAVSEAAVKPARAKKTAPVLAPPRGPGRPRKPLPGTSPSAGLQPLDRDRILEAALSLIDRHGLQAFNIRALADSLKVFPAAIYWHVPSRNGLVSGAVALAMHGIVDGLDATRSDPWQDRLRALLRRYREVIRSHPRLAPLVASELIGNAEFDAALLDHVLQLLEDAGFAGDALRDAYNVVFAAMCGFATMELSSVPQDEAQAWEASCRAQIAGVDAQRHPALSRHVRALENRAFVLRWSSGEAQPLESGFEVWVDVIVRGLEARAAAT